MALSNLTWNEDQSAKFDLNINLPLNHQPQKNLNALLDALTCPLQIINWHWTPIIDPSWCKCMLYPPPIQCQKLLDRSLFGNRSTKQKKGPLENIFLHLYTDFGSKFKIQMAKNFHWTFLTSGKSALNGPANGPVVRFSKIWNRLRRAP